MKIDRMGWLGGLARLTGGSLLAVLLLPSLAAWPSAFLDRGPDGSPRASIFPIALTLFDPFVWACARNSLVVAATVAAGSLVVGVGLGLIVGRWRFWGRAPLWALAIVPMLAGPLLVAPGIGLALGGHRGWDWLAARSTLGMSAESLARWAALAWSGLAGGAPLVALATVAALGRVDPSWSEAARSVGASRARAWRDVVWPILRPGVARASAVVFTLTLVEPAGPLILGLRRTLAVQMIDAARRLDQPTRAATLALLAIAIAAAGRVAIGWWGGRSYARKGVTYVPLTSNASVLRAYSSRLALMAWCLLSVGPIWLSIRQAFQAIESTRLDAWWTVCGGWLADPELRGWAANSSATAGLAVAVDLAILRAVAPGKPGSRARAIGLVGRLFEAGPPLALGVGALATPWLLVALADSAGGPAGDWLRSVSLELSPGRSPGFLLVLALAIVQLPMLAGVAELARGRVRPARVDSSRLLGESDRRASRAGEGGRLGVVPVSSAWLAFAMASTNLAVALLLTPFSERRTLAPGVLGSLLESGAMDGRVAGPIAAILAVRLMAFALASRSRVGPIGEWFRAG